MRNRNRLESVALAAVLALIVVRPGWPGSGQVDQFEHPNRPDETVYLPNCGADLEGLPVWCNLVSRHER